jgi:hypothetical protein
VLEIAVVCLVLTALLTFANQRSIGASWHASSP